MPHGKGVERAGKYGTASVKRIYGDWTGPQLQGWKKVLLSHSIQPIQQFRYTTGKNATDSAMIIDAMDIMYTGSVEGFCIVSSDSDFTPLASRIRENGLTVYGFGKKATPEAFKKACDKFIYVENLIVDSEIKNNEDSEETDLTDKKVSDISKTSGQKTISAQKEIQLPEGMDRATLNLIYKAVKDNADENGWANLSMVGQYISAVKPDLDSRNYGRAKLSGLIKTLNLFETKIEMSQMFLRKIKKQSA